MDNKKLIIRTLKKVIAESPAREIKIREGSRSGYIRRGEFSFRLEMDLGNIYWPEESFAEDTKNLKKTKKPFESLPDTIVNELYLKAGYGGMTMGVEVVIKVPEDIRNTLPKFKKEKSVTTFLDELKVALSNIKKEENTTEI